MSASEGLVPQTLAGTADAHLLQPYVPRLVIDWLRREPRSLYQRVDGSLAFVDISGFTKLAERLAKKGKVGAEELSDTLDDCFTQLLSVAYDYGAGVIKWGGDAVLLLFTDEGHAVRASRAAAEMQRTIRRIGHIRTESGSVRLRMSVGVNTAPFHFFLVGDTHRELVIVGGSATETVALESAADAGEVVVSPSTAAALRDRYVGDRKGPGFLLRGLPTAEIARSAPVTDLTDIDIFQCVPVAIRNHLIQPGREPEHRSVGVAFIEFGGTDDFLQQAGSDALAHALHECMSAVQQSTARHLVSFHETDISSNGGKVLLLSGAPRSAGNEEERLLRAVRAIMDAGTQLPLRIGVNCGRVFSGDFGPSYRRSYSVKGDAVNLAARLMGKAQYGQIIAADEIVARSRTAFELEPLEPFFVKGKSNAIIAHNVGALVGRQDVAPKPPFVGREIELGLLTDALAAARAWDGRFIEVVGEAGMGKSRLVQEVKDRAEGLTLVAAACEEYESSTPYFPFRELLRLLLGIADLSPDKATVKLKETVETLAPHLLPWLPLIAIPLQLDVGSTPEVDQLDEEFRRVRLEEALEELLGLGLLAPTLIVFEDLHWMDAASCDLLRRVVDGLENRPWFILTTRRESAAFNAPEAPWAKTLRLAPLEEADAVRLVHDATADAPIPPHLLAALTARADGNPLYLAELIASTQRLGDAALLPDSLEGLIAAEIDRLPLQARSVLRRAAVLGTSVDADLLRTVVPDVPADDDLWLDLRGFLRKADDRLQFRHALVRDVAYEGLPYKRRRELHGSVAEAIERSRGDSADDEAALLSLHFFEAQRFDAAWRYSRIAGDAAKEIYANAEAATFFERALASARRLQRSSPEEVATTTESLGDVRARLGDYDGAGVAYRAARHLAATDPAESARLMLKEARAQWRRGRHAQALRWIRRGLREVEGVVGASAQKQRAELYAWHGVVRLRQGRTLEAIDWCRKAIDEATHVDAREALAHASYLLDYALVALGRYAEAVYSDRALAIYEELGDLDQQGAVLNNCGMYAYFQGNWDESISLYQRAEEVLERAGDRWHASFATANRGELLSDQGRYEEAAPLLRTALRIARASGTGARIADVLSHDGRLAARSGQYEEAHALLDEARELYATDGAHADALLMDARIAECFAFEGRAEEALARADAALDRVPSLEGIFLLLPFLLRVRGWALWAMGRVDEAREVLKSSLSGALEKKADYEVALAADCLAALYNACGDPVADLEDVRDAIFDKLGVIDPPVLPAVLHEVRL